MPAPLLSTVRPHTPAGNIADRQCTTVQPVVARCRRWCSIPVVDRTNKAAPNSATVALQPSRPTRKWSTQWAKVVVSQGALSCVVREHPQACTLNTGRIECHSAVKAAFVRLCQCQSVCLSVQDFGSFCSLIVHSLNLCGPSSCCIPFPPLHRR